MRATRLDAQATMHRRNQRVEFALHSSAVDLLRWAYPQLVFWHTPNGELRDEGTGRKLKQMGLRAGVPDLAVIIPPAGHLGFIEFKAPDERPDDNQRLFMDDAMQRGAMCAIAYTLDDVIAALKAWGIAPRNYFTIDGKAWSPAVGS